MAGERWFDGDVTGVDFLGLRNIIEVKEYRNLRPTCSQDSYYGCLAKQFINGPKVRNMSYCKQEKLCFPFSLPSYDSQVPVCQNPTVRTCFKNVLLDIEKDLRYQNIAFHPVLSKSLEQENIL